MGVCCSKEKFEGFKNDDEFEDEQWEEEGSCGGDFGARVRLKKSSMFVSMFTQQGRKGVNQDAMTMWKEFAGQSDMMFCGVFDGHGPSGHKVAGHVRDALPAKISSIMQSSNCNNQSSDDVVSQDDNRDISPDEGSEQSGKNDEPIPFWKSCVIKAFEDLDQELSDDSSIDTYCSGSTAVVLIKQEEHLMIANLGDSRAILCIRDTKNQLVPVQLSVDLKPNLPSEAERIESCNGRVFAMDEEPDVYRLWLPDDNSPGLAMARAFGDFCLKDYGLISTPKVSYRKLSSMDEFVVLATDGVWDVLSNTEVVKIVASARMRSMAAKLLVRRAVRAWKTKYPSSKIDDCAVICLFLKPAPFISRSTSSISRSTSTRKEGSLTDTESQSFKSARSKASFESQETVTTTDEKWNAPEGVSRSNTMMNLPRFSNGHHKIPETSEDEDIFVSM